MKSSIKYTENSKKGTVCNTFCNKCHIVTKHHIIFDVQERGQEYEDGISWIDDYQIIKCDNCKTISFRKDGWFSEYQDYDNDGSYEELYPYSEEKTRKEKKYKKLPFLITGIYNEVIIAYNNKLKILSSVGIRSILDGICRDKKINSGIVLDKNGKEHRKTNLEGKIYGLLQNQLINKTQSDALHELRFIGNSAIHELDEPPIKDIQTALDIIEHMIDDIYEMPFKCKRLEEHRVNKTELRKQ